MAGRKPLYRDLMTWRAVRNALAGLLAGVAGGVLLGGLILIWGVTLFTLATSTDDWEHVAVYVGIVLLIMALTPWLVHGLSAMQRSRLRATLGAEIPAPVRPLGRTWHQFAYHLLALFTGLGGVLLVPLFPVVPRLAGWATRTDEGLARTLLGPGRRESLAQRVETLARSRAGSGSACRCRTSQPVSVGPSAVAPRRYGAEPGVPAGTGGTSAAV